MTQEAELKYVKIHMSKQENAQVFSDGSETRQVSITFAFNPEQVEMVKTRSGDYIIREKK